MLFIAWGQIKGGRRRWAYPRGQDSLNLFDAGRTASDPGASERPRDPGSVDAMSRQPRLNIADGVYHVTQRSLERRRIVVVDDEIAGRGSGYSKGLITVTES